METKIYNKDYVNKNKKIKIFSVRDIIEDIENKQSIMPHYDNLDLSLNNFKKGNVYVIAGKIGRGKTQLVNNIISNIVDKTDKKILSFLLRENVNSCLEKLIALDANIPVKLINFEKIGLLDEQKRCKIEASLSKLKNSNLNLCTENNIEKIYKIIMNIRPDIIFIDQFYNLTWSYDYSKHVKEQLEDISCQLKILAQMLDIPIIITVTLSTKLRKDKFYSYNIYDILECGFKSNKVDGIIFCYTYNDKMKLKIINNINGTQKIIRYNFNQNTGLIY